LAVTLFPVARSPRLLGGDFAFDVFAHGGSLAVLRSIDLTNWTNIGSVTITTPNYPGVTFTDTNSPPRAGAFYRLVQ